MVSVDGSRAKVKCADGSMRMVDVRDIDLEVDAKGEEKRHAATLAKGPTTPRATALLARLVKGEVLELPDLVGLSENCTQEVLDGLQKTLAGKAAAPRALAAQALALSATQEGVKAAIAAAKADPTLWKGVANALDSGAALAAMQAIDARADIETAMTHKDRIVRFCASWVAAHLESKDALPVLATFLADSDHHIRESAAVGLAECGDAAGAKVLMTMAKREKSPAMDANRDADAATRDLVARGARQERIRACKLLGALKAKDAVATLTSLGKHGDPDIAAAAKAALAAIQQG
ncbi:MAG: HEAT repeat domain-containing protein [Planctomycetes bacterium]|nr:HEAT repeat domain-containing protein [Planctomycetota bacterium]